MKKTIRYLLIIGLAGLLSGCLYWLRAYETYLQMDEFDRHFGVSSDDGFNILFKDPVLYSEDFIALARLHPSARYDLDNGELWHYQFRKVDEQGQVVVPEVSFYFDLEFNQEQKITRWKFSDLFLQIAPADFLELSLRSLAGAEINRFNRQLKADPKKIMATSVQPPLQNVVVKQLGEPLKTKISEKQIKMYYQFILDSPNIEPGYEDRALSEIKLEFDPLNETLMKMSGRFAGLKISIDYRDFDKAKTPLS
jgi:hypothetical protein